jgi:hypothetical protein
MADETAGTDTLSRLLAVAEEQLRWQRASALPQVRDTVEKTLTTSQLRQAYELCDGSRVSSDVAKAVGTSKQNFSGWTRRWRDLGIAFETGSRRIQHLTSLKALGIALEAGDGETPARRRRPKAA